MKKKEMRARKIEQVSGEIARIRAEAIKPLQAEIDLTYEMWCGRDYMHLPLHDAVGEAIKYAESAARKDTLLESAEREKRISLERNTLWELAYALRFGKADLREADILLEKICPAGYDDEYIHFREAILSNSTLNDNSCDTCKHKAVDCSCWEGRLPDDGDCPDHEPTNEVE